MTLRTVAAQRYVAPLREGGSLPAIVEADDEALYVMKFVGAGQGSKALIAELMGAELARPLGLNVPEIVLITLDPGLSPAEPNQEVSDLLRSSAGLNLGLRFLPHAFEYNPATRPEPGSRLASEIVWFDAFITNVDRTPRNTNLLMWQRQLWLIDHGAAFYFHHSWSDYLARSRSSFPMIKEHVLLPFAADLAEVDLHFRNLLTAALITEVLSWVPDVWLDRTPFASPAETRQAYVTYLVSRLNASSRFVAEAQHARSLRL
jgi:hypothetical protein